MTKSFQSLNKILVDSFKEFLTERHSNKCSKLV